MVGPAAVGRECQGLLPGLSKANQVLAMELTEELREEELPGDRRSRAREMGCHNRCGILATVGIVLGRKGNDRHPSALN